MLPDRLVLANHISREAPERLLLLTLINEHEHAGRYWTTRWPQVDRKLPLIPAFCPELRSSFRYAEKPDLDFRTAVYCDDTYALLINARHNAGDELGIFPSAM